jgi:hypothetical protein
MHFPIHPIIRKSNHPFHVLVMAGGADQAKTHDRFQPWVLVKTWCVQQAPTASATTTTTTGTACRTFFNITRSVYPSYRPGQALFLANFNPFFARVDSG